MNENALRSFHCLNFLHLLNVSCASLLFKYVAFGLDFPLADLNNLVTECRCNLFQSLVSRFTVVSISDCCLYRTSRV